MNDLHLSAITSVVGSILKEQRSALETQIAGVRALLIDLVAKAEAGDACINDFETRITELDQLKTTLVEVATNNEENIKKQADALTAYQGALRMHVSEIKEEIERLEAVQLEAGEELHSKVAQCAEEVENLTRQLEGIPAPYDYGKDIKQLHDLLIVSEDDWSAKHTELKKDIDGLTDALLTLQEHSVSDSDLKDAIKDISCQLFTLSKQIDEVNTEQVAERRLLGKAIDLELQSLRDRIQTIGLVPGPKGEKGDPGPCGVEGPVGPEGVAGLPGADGIGLTVQVWEPGIFIEGEVVQYGFGKLARAKCRTNKSPDNREDWERIGTCGFDLRGVKVEGANYENGDVFIDDGSCFVQAGSKPRMLVKRGRNGHDGSDGRDGKDGRDGSDGPKPVEIRAHSGGIAFAWDDGTVVDLSAESLRPLLRFEMASMLEESEAIPMMGYCGQWDTTRMYQRGHTVTVGASLYLCKFSAPPGAPVTGAFWDKIAG